MGAIPTTPLLTKPNSQSQLSSADTTHSRQTTPSDSTTYTASREVFRNLSTIFTGLPQTASVFVSPSNRLPATIAGTGIAEASLAAATAPIAGAGIAETSLAAAITPHIGSYEEMTKRLPKEQLSLIEAKLAMLVDFSVSLGRVIELLDDGQFDKLPDDAFYLALKGLKDNSALYPYLLRICEIETLKKQGIEFTIIDLNELIKDKTPAEVISTINALTDNRLNATEVSEFVAKIDTLAKVDRYLISFKDPSPIIEKEKMIAALAQHFTPESGVKVTIAQVLETKQQFRILNRPHQNSSFKLSSSIGLFSLFLQVKFKEHAVTPNPVLGISTPDQIRNNGLTNTRDVCFLHLVPNTDGSSQLAKEPSADGYACLGDDFNYHDRYHCFVQSSIPKPIRHLSVQLADTLYLHAQKQKKELSPADYRAMRNIRWHCLDMDYALYYLRPSETPEKLFVQSFFSFYRNACAKFDLAETLKDPTLPASERAALEASYRSMQLLKFDSFAAILETFCTAVLALPDTEAFRAAKEERARAMEEIITQFRLDLNTQLLEAIDHPAQQAVLREELAAFDEENPTPLIEALRKRSSSTPSQAIAS